MSRFNDWEPGTVVVHEPTGEDRKAVKRYRLEEKVRKERPALLTKGGARALAAEGIDQLAEVFGKDVAGDLRALGTTPAMDDWLVSLAIRRDARERNPVYGEDLADALCALEDVHARLRRDFPLLEFGSGIAEGIERVRKRARDLGLPRKQGRPPWLRLAVDGLRKLGASATAARDMAELAGLAGPTPRKGPSPP